MADPDDSSPTHHLPLSESQATLNAFWPTITDEIKRIKSVDAKNQVLPLARIKKIMKLDEDVKMISAEAPLLFAKAAEIFIHELTLRAWVHTEDNKRRTLQRNDIAMAITKYDQFDFLIDIVPREEIVKPPKKHEPAAASSVAASSAAVTATTMMTTGSVAAGVSATSLGDIKPVLVDGVLQTQLVQTSEPVQYYLQLAQQHQQALTQQQQQQQQQQQHQVQLQQQQHQQHLHQPMHVLQTTTTAPSHHHQQQQQQQQQIQHLQMNGAITLSSPSSILLAQPHQPQQQHIQLVQQIVTPNGEIQHVPIQLPQNQLNLLRMQMQQQQQHQQPHPIILQASPLQGQQIMQLQQSPQQQQQIVNGAGGLFINATTAQQQQQQLQQQQQQQQQQLQQQTQQQQQSDD